MAQASKATELVEKVVFENKEVITLKLSREEAQVLGVICAKIYGDGRTTARGYVDEISKALADVKCGYSQNNPYFENSTGSISFEDVKK